MALRISAFFVILFSILFMPFWLSVMIALAAMLYFDLYWEAVLLFLLSDLLYGVGEPRFLGSTYVSFIASVLALVIVESLKKKTVFYPNILKR